LANKLIEAADKLARVKFPSNYKEMCEALLSERATLRRQLGHQGHKNAAENMELRSKLKSHSHAAKVLCDAALDEGNSMFEDVAFPAAHRIYNATPEVSHEQRLEHAILASLRALADHEARESAGEVEVKPLVWEREDDGSLTAESVFGLYAVYFDEGHGWLVILDGSDDTWAKYPEEDFGFEADADAVDACNKDYARRIRNALAGG